jgi:hypothetical protein
MKLFKEFFEPAEIIQEAVTTPEAQEVLEELENLTPGVHKMKAEYHADMAMAASHRKDVGEFQKHMASHYEHMEAFHKKTGNVQKADEAKAKRSQYLKEEGPLEVEFEPLNESAHFDLAAYHDAQAQGCLGRGDKEGHHMHMTMHHDHMAAALADKTKEANWHGQQSAIHKNKARMGNLTTLNEGAMPGHKFGIVISKPQSDEKITRTIRVPGYLDESVAQACAEDHYQSRGYKVHEIEHIGSLTETQEALEEARMTVHEKLEKRLNKLDPDREARHKKIRELYMQTHDGKTPEQVEHEKREKMHAEIRAELAKHGH